MKRLWLSALAAGALPLWCQAQAMNCESAWYTVANQTDADNIGDHMASVSYDCMNHYGLNIVISPLCRGTIEITVPPEIFRGVLTVDNAPLLEKLAVIDNFSTWYRGFRYVRFSNLSSLTSIEFHTVMAPDTASFGNLPVLESIFFNSLWQSAELLLFDLSRLTNITAPNLASSYGARSANTTIHNVGFDSVQDAFDVNPDSIFAFDVVPNMKNLTITRSLKSLDFTGDGDVSLLFNCTRCFTRWTGTGPPPWGGIKLGDLRLSGLSSVSRTPVDMWPSRYGIYVQTFRVVKNTFRTLDLGFDSLFSLYVEDNPNLESINFHANAANYTWAEIVITGNPLLRLKSAVWTSSEPNKEMTTTFYWPQGDCFTMVFDGPFDNEFFQPFIDLHVSK
ncbi:hypothetical protein QBC47DRAFT_465376, partial [Echria macrotheca]